MKIRCLLIDDEPPALKVLQSYIDQINGLEVVALCNNAIEAMDILHSKTIDVMFLDIKMPMIIGTEFLRSLTNTPKVIFVTAYRDYAVEGFELDAVLVVAHCTRVDGFQRKRHHDGKIRCFGSSD